MKLGIVRYLSKLGCRVRQISATNGKNLNAGQYFQLATATFAAYRYRLTPSELGCAMSHREAIIQISQSDEIFAAVFEEDAIPTQKLDRFVKSLEAKNIQRSFIHLGGLEGLPVTRNIKIKMGGDGFMRVHPLSLKYLWRSCGYVIDKIAAKSLAEYTGPYFRADDYATIYKIMSADICLQICVQHPTELGSSKIEPERKAIQIESAPRHKLIVILKRVAKHLRYRFETVVIDILASITGHQRL